MLDLQAFFHVRQILPWQMNRIFIIVLYLHISLVFLLKCSILQGFSALSCFFVFGIYFPGKEDDLCGIGTVEYLPSGKVSRKVTLREVFAQATFVSVQHDLMHLKDKAIEQGKLSEAHSPKSVGEQP